MAGRRRSSDISNFRDGVARADHHPQHEAAHRFFLLAIWLKGLDGAAELVAGLGLALTGPGALVVFVQAITARELSEDPGDLLGNLLRHLAAGLTPHAEHFAAAYLLLHGAIKLFLAIALIRDVRWAYPVASLFFGAFLAYMGYRLGLAWSWLLLALILVDLATLGLILLEWRRTAAS
jgi:uncharacterized membrane protein